MATPPKPNLRGLFAVLVALVLIALAIAFVDRAASTWSFDHLHRPQVLVWFTHLVDPLQPIAILSLALAGIAALGGWRPARHGQAFLSACIAVLLSVAVKEQLKYWFGRTWPETWVNKNPSWIQNHVYGFNWLHGGEGWASFPSGHTTQMAALAAVVWLTYPRFRWLGVALVVAVAIGLWGADFHFVGDILAGGLIGISSGVAVVALVRKEPSPGSNGQTKP